MARCVGTLVLWAGVMLALTAAPAIQAARVLHGSGCQWQGKSYNGGSWAQGPEGWFQCGGSGQWCKGGCGGGGGGGGCQWQGKSYGSGLWAQGPEGWFQCGGGGQWCKGGCGGSGGSCQWQGKSYGGGTWAQGPEGWFQCGSGGQWCKAGCGGGGPAPGGGGWGRKVL